MDSGLPFLGELDRLTQDQLLSTALLLVFFWAVRWGAVRFVRHRVDDPEARYRWRKVITYATVVLAVLLIGRVWSSGLRQLGTFLGLLTAALAIALREPVTNLAGWLFILWRRPFRLGDRIQIGPHIGDVVDLRVFQFSLMEIGNWVAADQATGRIVHVPNGKVFTEPQANYSSAFPYIWNEIEILVTFESNWREAKRLLEEIAARRVIEGGERGRHTRSATFAIAPLAGDPAVYTSVADQGVRFSLRYLCSPRQRRGTAQEVWEEVLTAFGERPDIDFAYPTTRLYNNQREGKIGARASEAPLAGGA